MLPTQKDIALQVANSLNEDIDTGDITAQLIPTGAQSKARLITREAAIMCGRAWADEVFAQLGDVTLDWQVEDGEAVAANQTLCLLEGNSRKLLTGERTALNFLQLLMGTATTAQRYKQAVAGRDVTILDTRKTLPGLRLAQKYAIACGGCRNHRIGLYDAFLIKENHIAACGSITDAINKARALDASKPLIIEVETLQQLKEAAAAKPDRIMLDNFSPADIAKAAAVQQAGVDIEVSGNIDIEDGQLPEADFPIFISSGALTKHLHAIDLSMRLLD